jgi:predicted  nucleic acid-binding Zn-ribbon protein
VSLSEVVNREIVDKEAELQRLEKEEKKLRAKLESSQRLKTLRDQEDRVRAQLDKAAEKVGAIEIKIYDKVISNGERYVNYTRSSSESSFTPGVNTNIRPEVFAAIKAAGVHISHLKNSQIEEIARHIIEKEKELVADELAQAQRAYSKANRENERVRNKVFNLEFPARKLERRIIHLQSQIDKLKKEASHGGKGYDRKVRERNTLKGKLNEIYEKFKETKVK